MSFLLFRIRCALPTSNSRGDSCAAKWGETLQISGRGQMTTVFLFREKENGKSSWRGASSSVRAPIFPSSSASSIIPFLTKWRGRKGKGGKGPRPSNKRRRHRSGKQRIWQIQFRTNSSLVNNSLVKREFNAGGGSFFTFQRNGWLLHRRTSSSFPNHHYVASVGKEGGGEEGVVIAKFGGGKRRGDFIGPSLFPPSSAPPPPHPPPNDDDSIFPEKKKKKGSPWFELGKRSYGEKEVEKLLNSTFLVLEQFYVNNGTWRRLTTAVVNWREIDGTLVFPRDKQFYPPFPYFRREKINAKNEIGAYYFWASFFAGAQVRHTKKNISSQGQEEFKSLKGKAKVVCSFLWIGIIFLADVGKSRQLWQ